MTDQPFVSGVGGPMIQLPHRGHLLVVKCQACEHSARIGGREIVTRFTKYLRVPVVDWAATLRCGECQSRNITVYPVNDDQAGGFLVSNRETAFLVWARRLNTWLAEVGEDVWAYADVLQDLPDTEAMQQAGIRPLSAEGPAAGV